MDSRSDEEKLFVTEINGSPVRWLSPSNATMYGSDNKPAMCKCGKPAATALIGKEAFSVKCSECMKEMYQKSKDEIDDMYDRGAVIQW